MWGLEIVRIFSILFIYRSALSIFRHLGQFGMVSPAHTHTLTHTYTHERRESGGHFVYRARIMDFCLITELMIVVVVLIVCLLFLRKN